MFWKDVKMRRDMEGYTTQQCKGCDRMYKVAFGQGSHNKPIVYCPYCGWHDGQFWTCDQMKYLDCMASNKLKSPAPPCDKLEPDEDLPSLPANKVTSKCKNTSESHTEPIKHDGNAPAPQFCIICKEKVDLK
jgi:hypothetical protein